MKSEEHENTIKILSERYNLNVVKVRGNENITGKYFPDMINDHTDYEVEVVPRKHYLLKKQQKWDKSRKKVLILKPNSFAYENFDKIFVFLENNELFRIK